MNNKVYAPVVLFAYKRLDKVKKCLESLEKNDKQIVGNTLLYIYSDGYKSEEDKADVLRTQEYIKEYVKNSAFADVRIVISAKNKGLATSVIEGVTEVINNHNKIIVVEDDLTFSCNFLKFMNEALEFYEENLQIGQINGYTYPIKELENYPEDVYFLTKGDCWGWATWKNRWNNAVWRYVNKEEYLQNRKRRKLFEQNEAYWDWMMINQLNGKIDSWAIRWVYYLFCNNLYAVYPRVSLVSNNGFDGSGTHKGNTKSNVYSLAIDNNAGNICLCSNINENAKIKKSIARFMIGNIIVYLYIRIRCYFAN